MLRKIALVVMGLAIGYGNVLADNAKKSPATKASPSTGSVLPIGSGAVIASVKAVAGRTKAMAKVAKAPVSNDTAARENRILFARAASDLFSTRIELMGDEPLIEVGIYNMLGKRVMDVYKGASGRGQHDFSQSVSELPEGVYICILQGDNFRKAEKFYFRR